MILARRQPPELLPPRRVDKVERYATEPVFSEIVSLSVLTKTSKWSDPASIGTLQSHPSKG
jgi:hypothetical protein